MQEYFSRFAFLRDREVDEPVWDFCELYLVVLDGACDPAHDMSTGNRETRPQKEEKESHKPVVGIVI
jgi:hypothetical protein